MITPNDVEAEIYFLSSKEGGRESPVFNEYRPQFYYDGHDWDACHNYPDVKQVNPGDTVRSYLGFLSPAEHYGKIHIGMEFLLREGARTVGRGIITKILELEKSAKLIGE